MLRIKVSVSREELSVFYSGGKHGRTHFFRQGKPWIDGIGEKVLEAGYSASGIDLDDTFLNLKFSEQVAQTKLFIEREWDRCPLLIGRSYGGCPALLSGDRYDRDKVRKWFYVLKATTE